MVQELIIHLGDCKTGSTAIQTCLASKGFDVPGGEIFYPTQFNHNPLAQSLSDQPGLAAQQAFLDARFRKVAEAMAQSDARWGVISAELFEFVSPSRLAEELQRYMPEHADRVRLIAYVRPHHSRLVSAYAERIKKTGGPPTMATFYDNRHKSGQLAYFDRFSAWRSVFGAALRVKPFMQSRLMGGDVVKDFLSFVSGSPDVQAHQTPRRNSSLSLRNLVMLRVAHQRLGNHPDLEGPLLTQVRQQLGWHMAPYLSAFEPAGSERLYVPRKLAERVRAAYRDDATAMDEAFFRGRPLTNELRSAPEKAPDRRQSLKPEDHFDAEELGMIRGWTDFLAHIARSDPAHFSWAVRPEVERQALSMTKSGDIQIDPIAAPS